MYITKTACVMITLSTSLAYAGTMGPAVKETNPKESIYLGAGVGASINNDKFSVVNVQTNVSDNQRSNNTNALGNVFLGYGHTFTNAFYLGGEANIYFPNRIVSFTRPGVSDFGVSFADTYAINDNIAVDLLPGYRVNPNMLAYARVGMSFRDTILNQPARVAANEPNWHDSANTIVSRFGAGLTYGFTQHFAASVDYFYSYAPTVGSAWVEKSLQFSFNSSSNYIGGSIIYTI